MKKSLWCHLGCHKWKTVQSEIVDGWKQPNFGKVIRHIPLIVKLQECKGRGCNLVRARIGDGCESKGIEIDLVRGYTNKFDRILSKWKFT